MPDSSVTFFSRRKFLGTLAGAAAGAVAAGALAQDGRFPSGCRLRRATIAGPAGWVGKRAVFLTDLHFGNYFGAEDAARLQALVRAQKPDLVLMGGDLADTPQTNLEAFFAAWAPACPVLFAPGNHDLWVGARESAVMRQVAEAGITVLANRAEVWNGLRFVGLPSALRAYQQRSLLDGPELKIVLAHEPDLWDGYTQTDLVHLAGHTHGGQICLFGHPLRLPPLGRKYRLGRFTAAGNRTLIVSAGLGCVTVPARIGCPPEIQLLEFV